MVFHDRSALESFHVGWSGFGIWVIYLELELSSSALAGMPICGRGGRGPVVPDFSTFSFGPLQELPGGKESANICDMR